MKATLGEINHKDQRYETVGDWILHSDTGQFDILVSKMPIPDFVTLVQVHELIEAWLCFRRGITQEQVDAFDIEYERNRPEGDESEPGDDPKAPYFREHQFATKIEKLFAEELGVDWAEYERAIYEL
jgi:hypothetical protein